MLALILALAATAAEPWPYLDTSTMGADTFAATHPEWDGRGVAIAVLDTGVSLDLPGLLTTSDGRPKVVEARDFSGQGDVELAEAEWRDGVARHPDGWTLEGLDATGVAEGSTDLLLGAIEEDQFTGSAGHDLDGDGAKGERRWAVAAAPGEGGWRVWVDTDGDGDLAGEAALSDFGADRSTFVLAGDPLAKGGTRHVIAPTLDPREAVLSLHFDDGGHGTHVAGIAAGYRLGDQEGFDGVAPGAQVLSLKIGHTALAGGATVSGSMQRAFEYGARWSEEHGVPVVFNLSYGIDSGREGHAALESFLDELLAKHPQCVVVTSAGNEGPGLSTLGLPGAGQSTISVGSVFTRDLSVHLRGQDIRRDRVVVYSSRGGEAEGPDVVAPGLAFSTIAPWDRGPVKSGTSMSSPAAAGAVALLLSAARAEGQEPTWDHVRRALWATASPLQGYTPLDQGGGMVDVPAAWAALRRLAAPAPTLRPLAHRVAYQGPKPPGYTGRTAYWRAGGYAPERRGGLRFRVTPVFDADADPDSVTAATWDATLRSDVPWLAPDRGQAVFQGIQPRDLGVRLDGARLTEPGVYVGRVWGTPRGERVPAFALTAVVVVPDPLDEHRSAHWVTRLDPGELERRFVHVPAGATALEVRVAVPEGNQGKLWVDLSDPMGLQAGRRTGAADGAGARELVWRVARDDLSPGTWELDLTGAHDARASEAEVEVRFFGLAAEPAVVEQVSGGATEPASARVTVTNAFDQPFLGRARGSVDHLWRRRDLEAEPAGWSQSVELTEARPRAAFRFEVDLDTWAQLTDLSIHVLDSDGQVVRRGSVGPRGGEVTVRGPGEFTVELHLAAADAAREEPVPFALEERVFLAEALPVSVRADDDAALGLYPGIPAELSLEIAGTLPAAEGFAPAGAVTLREDHTEAEWLVIPLRLR